jgi:hypothetical protein
MKHTIEEVLVALNKKGIRIVEKVIQLPDGVGISTLGKIDFLKRHGYKVNRLKRDN